MKQWFKPSLCTLTVSIKECNYLAFWQLRTYSSRWPSVNEHIIYYLSSSHLKVKVGFLYSANYAVMPWPAMLYNRRKWQFIWQEPMVPATQIVTIQLQVLTYNCQYPVKYVIFYNCRCIRRVTHHMLQLSPLSNVQTEVALYFVFIPVEEVSI